MAQCAMPDASAITLSKVSFAYPNGVRALAPIDLSVRQGEFVSLLGPSGCGKSTLLRLVAGLISPGTGSLRLGGEFSDLRTGYVFQSPTLMPWADIEANVRLPHTLSGRDASDAAARVNHALHMVGLEAFRHAWPRELSGGMQMRASIARALAVQPRLLLMDEPFAALDEITRNRLDNDLLKLWSAQSLTALFVTHSVFESVFLSTRIVVMSSRPGKIVGEVVIDEAHPRGEDFRSSDRFTRYCAEATRLLDLGMAEEGIV